MRVSLDRIARPFVVFSERYYPDPFVFAIVLTGLTVGLAIVATPTMSPDSSTSAESVSSTGTTV